MGRKAPPQLYDAEQLSSSPNLLYIVHSANQKHAITLTPLGRILAMIYCYSRCYSLIPLSPYPPRLILKMFLLTTHSPHPENSGERITFHLPYF